MSSVHIKRCQTKTDWCFDWQECQNTIRQVHSTIHTVMNWDPGVQEALWCWYSWTRSLWWSRGNRTHTHTNTHTHTHTQRQRERDRQTETERERERERESEHITTTQNLCHLLPFLRQGLMCPGMALHSSFWPSCPYLPRDQVYRKD